MDEQAKALAGFVNAAKYVMENRIFGTDWSSLIAIGEKALSIQQQAEPLSERRNPNSGHGHVFPRPDGVRARCGGPGICAECSRDAAVLAKQGDAS